jgi:hypothetical protein
MGDLLMDDGKISASVKSATEAVNDGIGKVGAYLSPTIKADAAELIGKLQDSLENLGSKLEDAYDTIAPEGILASISDVTRKHPLTALLAVASLVFVATRVRINSNRRPAPRRRRKEAPSR